MSNSLLSSAVIAVIVVVVSGYVISYSVDIDTVADVVFTAMLNVAYATHGVLSLNATDSIDNLDGGTLELDGAWDIATFKSGVQTYAIVTASNDAGVQILNITDPSNITAAGSIMNSDDLELNGPRGMATFESGTDTYAIVAAYTDDGVQILNITSPTNILPAGNITDDTTNLKLKRATDIAVFKSRTDTYAAVTAEIDDGVQILNITNPDSITAAGSIADDGTNTDSIELNGARGIATFKSGGHTYAAVAANADNGVQILNITNPYIITTAGSITNNSTLNLDAPTGITIFDSTGGTYAAITSETTTNTIQILNITNPSNITPAGNIDNAANLELDAAWGITTFKSGDHVYAAVAANRDDGVQILDVTDLPNITPVSNILDNDIDLELDGAIGITIFNSNGNTYAAVASHSDDGVQIIRIDVDERDVTPPVITLAGPLSVTTYVGNTYDDSDVTCTDETDPSPTLTPSIVVDTSQAGEYIVTYSCIDAATHSAEQVTRTVIVLNSLSLTATDNVTENNNLVLNSPNGITTFESRSNIYAVVTSLGEHGVQILNITNPSNVTAAGNIIDGGTLELSGARDVTTFKSDTHTYAVIVSSFDKGVQILNITDPSTITAAGRINDGGNLNLNEAYDVAIFKSDTHTYAAVAAARLDNGVQILNITDPSTITAAGRISDSSSRVLDSPNGIATFKSGTHTYAAVTSNDEHGVQILNVTDPTTITAAGSIISGGNVKLGRAGDISIFKLGINTYAAVVALSDDSVQILDITKPSNITAAGSVSHGGDFNLDDPRGITTFKLDGRTYAAVTASANHIVQILDITDPSRITAAGSISHGGDARLDVPRLITTFELDGHIYVAVTAGVSNGVQIIRIEIPEPNTSPTVDAGTDQTVGEGDTVTLSGTATDPEGDAVLYTWSAPTGSGITFTNASSASTTFTAPDVTSDTTYTFRLTASDGTDSGMDSVDVLVKETSGAFITTWRTTSAGQSITIPVGGATGTYDVIWGDGTISTGVTGDQTHTYATSGDHTVTISGGFERIYLKRCL